MSCGRSPFESAKRDLRYFVCTASSLIAPSTRACAALRASATAGLSALAAAKKFSDALKALTFAARSALAAKSASSRPARSTFETSSFVDVAMT
jgi:hypothetical protein